MVGRQERVSVEGVALDVLVCGPGEGTPVLLLHGNPDSRRLWDRQVSSLEQAGYRVVAPSLPGFGESDRPQEVSAYSLESLARCMLGLLDHLKIAKTHVVGHDFGAGLAWVLGMVAPERVNRLAVLGVGHTGAYFAAGGMVQREKSWYMLFFQQKEAEELLMANDWALLRQMFSTVDPADMDAYIADLSRPGALTAVLNTYRANMNLTWFASVDYMELPKLDLPVMGVWSSGDDYLTEAQMTESARYVTPGKWRYERLEGCGHWIPREAADKPNALLLDFFSAE